MNARSRLALGSAMLVCSVLLTSPAIAESHGLAKPYRVKDLEVLSGPTPFPNGCPGAFGDDAHIAGYEGEPSIAVNPRKQHMVIASWMQDLGPGGVSARSNVIASSHNVGRTWTRSTIPGLTSCTGGAADASADPWLSVGADGTAYVIGGTLSFTSEERMAGIVASHSSDGGNSWANVATVAPPDPRNDKPSITADPVLSGRAYALWANWDMQLNFPFSNLLEFARTDDKGVTWSEPVVVDTAPPNGIDVSNVVLVLPDGSLLAVFERIEIAPDFSATEAFFAARSSDAGDTWLPPAEIGRIPIAPISDPETGEGLPQPGFVSAAVGPDGNVYAAWERQSSPTSGAIDVARSFDGGSTWSVAPLPSVSAFAFEPSVAVDSHGTVGVTWYDLRNDQTRDDALTADVWFAHSDDAAASWQETHVAGPTNLRTAPLAALNRVGEYQGLAALKVGFVAIFTLASPQARNGPTDIFFARIGRG